MSINAAQLLFGPVLVSCAATLYAIVYFFVFVFFRLFVPSVLTKLKSNKVDLTKPKQSKPNLDKQSKPNQPQPNQTKLN